MNEMLLIDGNSMLFRAYYATSYTMMMRTSDGTPTNAVFAFNNMLNKVINLIKPRYVVVAFDKGKHTFRHDIYTDYKAGRKETPEDLIPQFKLIRDYLTAYNIVYYEMDDIEADDIIGTLSKKFNNTKVNVLSSDKDLLQLIDETTHCIMMKKGISDIDIIDIDKLKETMNIRPDQIIDLKSLMGDTADNIKGVPGIGAKTADLLLTKYDKLENVYDNIEDFTGKRKEHLVNGKESAFLSKELATIKLDVDIEVQLDDLEFRPDFNRLKEFYLKYEMQSLIKQMEKNTFDYRNNGNREIIQPISKKLEYKIIDNIDFLDNKKNTVLYFDIDNNGYYKCMVDGLAIMNDNKYYYVQKENIEEFKDIFKFKKIIIYDIKHFYHIEEKFNFSFNFLDTNKNIMDTKIISFLYDANINDFDKCLKTFQIDQKYSFKDLFNKKNVDFSLISRIDFSIDMLRIINKIYENTFKYMIEYDMENLYFNMELPLAKVLYSMEKNGMPCDYETLDKIASSTLSQLNFLTEQIYLSTGERFNINSPKQLAVVLYDKLELKSDKKRSTAQDKLEKLASKHACVDLILQYRKLSKLYSTYAEGLKKYIMEDKKIHTIFHQCLASTGRLSSSEPNLQNISIRDEESKQIRKAFVASDNHVLMSCDYSQVELRVLAHIANEETMIKSFNDGIDIHSVTASNILKKPLEDITENDRRKAKAVNFGIVYGISAFGLAKQVNISIDEAKEFITQYNENFPKINEYMNNVIKELEEKGYVTTLYKHRRIINEINSTNHMQKEFAKRAAMNTPIQGSAAEIIKIAMIRIFDRINNEELKSKMIMQIHDELIFEVDDKEIDIMTKLIKDEMENVVELSVKLDTDLHIGKSWYEAK
jgi:DNA polymerase-1